MVGRRLFGDIASGDKQEKASSDVARQRLVVHIGPGKTGSSAIQASLRHSRSQLERHGVEYWGWTLDFAPVQAYRWQHADPPYQFLREADWKAFSRQFVDVVIRSLARRSGVHTAIVSNEYFHEVFEDLIPLLKEVEIAGVEVVVVAYVRRHPAYAQSAYAQWALKHKAAPGRVVPFDANPGHFARRFADKLLPFDEAFGPHFLLRNFDATEDVVGDFLQAVGLDHLDVRRVYENARPSAEEELLRAFFNDRQPGRVLPEAFDDFVDPEHVDFGFDIQEWFFGLLPSQSDLDAISETMSDDRARLNALLRVRGQPELSADSTKASSGVIDTDRMLGIVVQILYSHHLQLATRRKHAARARRWARQVHDAMCRFMRWR